MWSHWTTRALPHCRTRKQPALVLGQCRWNPIPVIWIGKCRWPNWICRADRMRWLQPKCPCLRSAASQLQSSVANKHFAITSYILHTHTHTHADFACPGWGGGRITQTHLPWLCISFFLVLNQTSHMIRFKSCKLFNDHFRCLSHCPVACCFDKPFVLCFYRLYFSVIECVKRMLSFRLMARVKMYHRYCVKETLFSQHWLDWGEVS